MLQIKPHRPQLTVRISFARPILNWTNAFEAFSRLLYDCFEKKFKMSPGDFTVNPSNSLGGVNCVFRIFGGSRSVTLTAEYILFHFPDVASESAAAATPNFSVEVITQIHESFTKYFSDIEFNNIYTDMFIHYEILDSVRAIDYLNKHRVGGVEGGFSELGQVTYQPGVRYSVIGENQVWVANFEAEQSYLLANGIFVHMGVGLYNLKAVPSFEERYRLTERVGHACLAGVGLKVASNV